jgi:hypothetical protein
LFACKRREMQICANLCKVVQTWGCNLNRVIGQTKGQ